MFLEQEIFSIVKDSIKFLLSTLSNLGQQLYIFFLKLITKLSNYIF